MQTTDELAEILKRVKTNTESSINIDKILSAIRAKLQAMADDTETADLIRIYVANQKSSLEEVYSKVVTAEDFSNFRKDFADFLQKILDNANILHLNSDSNKEQIIGILEKIKTLDYNKDFEKIADSISEFKNIFTDNSKMNYENIIRRIEELKTDLTTRMIDDTNNRGENFNKIYTDVCDINANTAFLRDFSTQNSVEMLENITKKLEETADTINSGIISNSDINFGQIKETLENVQKQVEEFKTDMDKRNDTNLFNISSGFDGIKALSENILTFVNSISTNIGNSPEILLADVKKILVNIDELKEELKNLLSDCNNRMLNSVNELAVKVDTFTEKTNIDMELDELKNTVHLLKDEIKEAISGSYNDLKSHDENQISTLKDLSSGINEFHVQISGALENLRGLVCELNENGLRDNAEKLSGIEARLFTSGEEYKEKIETLQTKLSEFITVYENNSAETNKGISALPQEISQIKDSMTILNEYVQSLKLSTDEKFSQTVAMIDAGIENIVFNTNSINEHLENGGVSQSSDIDEKIQNIYNLVSEIKQEDNLKGIEQVIEDKMAILRQAVDAIDNDVTDTMTSKIEEIILAFGNVKAEFEKFAEIDFEQLLSDLKSQIESAYSNSNINDSLYYQSETIRRIEQVLTETSNKVSCVDEYVTDKLGNNLELLNAAFETGIKEIKSSFISKIEDNFEELKSVLALNSEDNAKISGLIADTKLELSQKISDLLDVQELFKIKDEEYKRAFTLLSSEIKKYVLAAGESIIDGCNTSRIAEMLSLVNEKLNTVSQNSISQEINQKVDLLSNNDKEISMSIEHVSERFNDLLQSNNTVNSSIKELNEKLDTVWENSNKFEADLTGISHSSNQINDILNAINTKVDILAMDEQVDIEAEIDDLKGLIFEQRKYFETLSDEKSEAIDRYLRDVLLKLDDVDLEKSADDIKNTIIGTLENLIGEISFTNASDDIKGFVQEKTEQVNQSLSDVQEQLRQISDEKAEQINQNLNEVQNELRRVSEEKAEQINQNLNEVQNQIKLLAKPDDAFDYTYTLQDVESDIAKLRLAINNMPSLNLESISSEISHITESIAGLESSLTLDEVSEIKSDFGKLSEDIESISSRTNKLLLNSDESYKTLSDSLDNFNAVIFNLENKLEVLNKDEYNERLERKIDYLHSMAVESANADKTFHQVMMYLGEWIDSTTGNISTISDKVSKIAELQENINELRSLIPNEDELINKIKELIPDMNSYADEIKGVMRENSDKISQNLRETIPTDTISTVKEIVPEPSKIADEVEKRLPDTAELLSQIRELIPDNKNIIDDLGEKFEKQEERIDRLEKQLDKILLIVEEKDNKVINRKIDKIEKLLSGFGANIEKLASYVDEE